MRNQYLAHGEGFLLVYSIVSRRTFNEIITHRENVYRAKDGVYPPMVLVGNKCDLQSKREVTQNEGKDLATTFGSMPFFETSALTRVNLEEAFHTLIRAVWKQRRGGGSSNADGDGSNLKQLPDRSVVPIRKRCDLF